MSCDSLFLALVTVPEKVSLWVWPGSRAFAGQGVGVSAVLRARTHGSGCGGRHVLPRVPASGMLVLPRVLASGMLFLPRRWHSWALVRWSWGAGVDAAHRGEAPHRVAALAWMAPAGHHGPPWACGERRSCFQGPDGPSDGAELPASGQGPWGTRAPGQALPPSVARSQEMQGAWWAAAGPAPACEASGTALQLAGGAVGRAGCEAPGPEKTELSVEALPRAALAGTPVSCGPHHAERREGERMDSGPLARPAPTGRFQQVPGAPTAAARRKPAPRASVWVLGSGGRSMGGPRVASLLDISRRGQGSRAHCRAALEAWEGGWDLAGQWYLLLP